MVIPALEYFNRISYDVLGMLTPSSVAGMQLIMWGKNMIALIVGWVGECCSELDIQLILLSQTLKNVFVGIFQDAARYKWGKKRSWCGLGMVVI